MAAKDTVVFVDDEESESVVEEIDPMDNSMDQAVGPDGEIDWDCPCLNGMTKGPCGEVFKAAFSCFVYSKADPKGSDCLEQFGGMHECMMKNAEFYDTSDDDEQGDDNGDETSSDKANSQEQPSSETSSKETGADAPKVAGQ
eukprot:m.7537 g.7537  ORF g.7537 m.7537 type:complete len:142 (-) comp6741_c0_seq1:9-434(-)